MRRDWHYWLRSVLQRSLCLLIAFSIIFLSTSIESNASSKGETYSINDSDDDGKWTISADRVYSNSATHSYSTYFYSLGQMNEASIANWLTIGHYYNIKFSGYISSLNTSNAAYTQCDVYFVCGNEKYLFCSDSASGYYTNTSFDFKYTGGSIGFLFNYSVTNSSSGSCWYAPSLNLRTGWALTNGKLVYITDLGTTSTEQDILMRIDETTAHTDQTMDEVNDTTKGIWETIKDFFGSFFQNLIDTIIGIFVPSSEEMSNLFDRLNQFFSDTFGFLYYPFDFIIRAFDIFLSSDSETGLTLPGFSIMGYEVWSAQTYDIASEPVVGEIFGYVRIGTGAMLAMWFVNYLRNFFDKRFGGGGN